MYKFNSPTIIMTISPHLQHKFYDFSCLTNIVAKTLKQESLVRHAFTGALYYQYQRGFQQGARRFSQLNTFAHDARYKTRHSRRMAFNTKISYKNNTGYKSAHVAITLCSMFNGFHGLNNLLIDGDVLGCVVTDKNNENTMVVIASDKQNIILEKSYRVKLHVPKLLHSALCTLGEALYRQGASDAANCILALDPKRRDCVDPYAFTTYQAKTSSHIFNDNHMYFQGDFSYHMDHKLIGFSRYEDPTGTRVDSSLCDRTDIDMLKEFMRLSATKDRKIQFFRPRFHAA
jgi:hypothetical protein